MSLFFYSLFCIVTGGASALLFWKKPNLGRTLPVIAIAVGSTGGLFSALANINAPHVPSSEWLWMGWLPLSFSMDALSAFFLIPVFAIAFFVTLYSYDYLSDPDKGLRTGANYLFFSFLITAMGLVVCADNIISLALAWEFMSISSCFLVLYEFEQKENRQAAYIFFIFTQAGAMFLFAAFGLLYAQTGSISLAAAAGLSQGFKLVVFILAFIGFGSKAGIFPFHIWLPHAHTAAPSHISAFMSGVMIKMGVYGILRFFFLLQAESPIFGQIVLCFGAVSGVLGIIYALGQTNIKRMLAYSSIENIGIIMIGLGMGMLGYTTGRTTLAFFCITGALLHVLNHAAFKSLLFLGAGSVLHGTRTPTIDRLGGLLKKMRFTGITFLAGSLAICALPPFNGFISEFMIYRGAFNGSFLEGSDFLFSILAIVSLAVIGGLAVACFTNAVGIVFLGEPRTPEADNAHECGKFMRLSMAALACLCLLIGLLPAFFIAPLARLTSSMLNSSGVSYGHILKLAQNISLGSAVFLLLVLLIYFFRHHLYRRKKVTQGPTWGCGFTRATPRIQYTGSSFAAPILEFFHPVAPQKEEGKTVSGIFPQAASYISTSEDRAENVAVNGIALPVLRTLKRLRWIQHGNIQLYIFYIVMAMAISILLICLL